MLLDPQPGVLEACDLPCTTLHKLSKTNVEAGWVWPLLPFNHPLFILFSSGTTGPPKCIVHGVGGTLLQHLKEHRLHTDLTPHDRLFFQTSCGWMMWNWMLSALASGTTLVLYEGSPTYPQADMIWNLVRRERVTVLGTSPAYLQYCRDAGLSPGEQGGLEALRAILSTGSMLMEPHYDWVGEHVKPVSLQSISGGTDIIGCFVLGNPTMPVYRGESPCVALGMDVHAFDPERQADVSWEQMGELICATPFPSRPLAFSTTPKASGFTTRISRKTPGSGRTAILSRFMNAVLPACLAAPMGSSTFVASASDRLRLTMCCRTFPVLPVRWRSSKATPIHRGERVWSCWWF